MTSPTGPDPVYPVAPESGDDDSRFTNGLLFDVVKVIESHGYPKLASGRDLLELRISLYRFLYMDKDAL
ncbi:hypothetical protein [Streptomyces violaceusniger]|uniref:Uncharacterized protein n=1 Tax=Streptomyces violaceusniger (strain Tu 4113) TaxID=653045 RepID=G2P9V8_STRV4|nr:hypothetical protein [Streptomyces violaceusniger]AEM80249.1 hypothetical protein Strvi_0471 [Streptomyces violaceusniger Tu 4113]